MPEWSIVLVLSHLCSYIGSPCNGGIASIDLMNLEFTYFMEEFIRIMCSFCRCFYEKHPIFLRKFLPLLQSFKERKEAIEIYASPQHTSLKYMWRILDRDNPNEQRGAVGFGKVNISMYKPYIHTEIT